MKGFLTRFHHDVENFINSFFLCVWPGLCKTGACFHYRAEETGKGVGKTWLSDSNNRITRPSGMLHSLLLNHVYIRFSM